ncbi:type IV secretion system protein VirB7 [Sinorhizobium meliloti]|nr:type IV secretion system protein VirB7 [Sinorhizobium meliloti]WQP36093.1 type IV secretion system protein VirB7 [Sinorhizobium meliloti]
MMGLLAAVSGCATLSYPLPKCDGYAKRPLNRSMWDWDAGKAQGDQQQSSLAGGNGIALAFADPSDEAAARTVAFAGFNEAGSHAACRAG